MSNRKGSPQPRTQALDLQLHTQHRTSRRGVLALSIWSLEGQVQSCGLLSHSWLQIRGSHDGPTITGSAPSHPSVSFPHTSKDSAMTERLVFSSFWRKGYVPSWRGETGLGAREYIHVAKAGSWGFQCHTQAVPRNGSSGGSPSAGLSSEPTSDRLALAALSPAPQCGRASELTQLVQFVQCSSKAAEVRGDFVVPSPGHLPQ